MKISQFILQLFTFDASLESLIRDQYEMSKKGITWTESSLMADFERAAVINMIIEDYKRESEKYKVD